MYHHRKPWPEEKRAPGKHILKSLDKALGKRSSADQLNPEMNISEGACRPAQQPLLSPHPRAPIGIAIPTLADYNIETRPGPRPRGRDRRRDRAWAVPTAPSTPVRAAEDATTLGRVRDVPRSGLPKRVGQTIHS